MNKIFTCINVLVLVFVVISGLVKGNIENWRVVPEDVLNATSGMDLKYVTRGAYPQKVWFKK